MPHVHARRPLNDPKGSHAMTATIAAPMPEPPAEPVHEWFGLSYANYLVVPRTFLQSMPAGWQLRIVACLRELRDAYEHVDYPDVYDVHAAAEHIVDEMSADELALAGITVDYYRGEQPPAGLDDEALHAWQEEHWHVPPTYHQGGRELDPGERVLLHVPDPVPHYNRGRTRIQPHLAAVPPLQAVDPGAVDAVLDERIAAALNGPTAVDAERTRRNTVLDVAQARSDRAAVARVREFLERHPDYDGHRTRETVLGILDNPQADGVQA